MCICDHNFYKTKIKELSFRIHYFCVTKVKLNEPSKQTIIKKEIPKNTANKEGDESSGTRRSYQWG